MSILLDTPPPPEEVIEERIQIQVRRNRSDRIFRGAARTAALATLVLMGLIGVFLIVRSRGSFQRTGLIDFLTTTAFDLNGGEVGIAALLFLTVLTATLALALAVPVSVAAALFITEYAPRWLRRPLTSLIDLLAAIPSLIYGIWGRSFFQGNAMGLSKFLADHVGWFPLFRVDALQPSYAASTFIAGMVLALMVVPICTAVIREAFSQAPPGEKEGALALGGTRWGMIRNVVLPFGRGAIIGGAMLGLGRAIGETIAVAIIISPIFTIDWQILDTGGNSIASTIALRFGEANEQGIEALMAAGLVLFALTLVVNFAASFIVSRSRSGAATEI